MSLGASIGERARARRLAAGAAAAAAGRRRRRPVITHEQAGTHAQSTRRPALSQSEHEHFGLRPTDYYSINNRQSQRASRLNELPPDLVCRARVR
jgi:hypothetical protein